MALTKVATVLMNTQGPCSYTFSHGYPSAANTDFNAQTLWRATDFGDPAHALE